MRRLDRADGRAATAQTATVASCGLPQASPHAHQRAEDTLSNGCADPA